MRYLPVLASNPGTDQSFRVCGFALRPLLELDNDGLVATGRIPSANHEIKTARRAGKFVLDDDPMVIQLRILNHLSHRAQRIPPGRHFRLYSGVSVILKERIREFARKLIADGVLDKCPGHSGIESQT